MGRKKRASPDARRRPGQRPADAAARSAVDRLAARPLLCFAVAALVALTLYGRGLGNGFTLDDHAYLEHNPQIRSLAGLGYLLLHPVQPGETLRGHLYRPFSALVAWAVGGAFGFAPLPFHLLGILLYALNGTLLFALLRRLLAPAAASVGALLFLVHPVHADVVASAAGWSEQIATGLQLLALLALLPAQRDGREEGQPGPRLLAASGAFLLALLAKETAVVWPAIAALLLLWRRSPSRRFVELAAAATIPLGVYFALRWRVMGALMQSPLVEFSPLDNPLCGVPAGERLLGAVQLLLVDLRLLLWPAELAADYSLASLPLVQEPTAASVSIAGLVLLLVAAAAWGIRRRLPEAVASLLFLGLALLPTSNLLFCGGAIFAERFLFFPSVALAWFGGAAWQRLATGSQQRRRIALVALALLLSAAGARTVRRVADWADDETLFRSVIEVFPDNAKGHYNMALFDLRAGRLGDSEAHARRAVELFDEYHDARVLLAELWRRRGAVAAAEDLLRATLRLPHTSEDAVVALGALYTAQGRLAEAAALYRKELAAIPHSARIPYNLGMIEMERGELERAEPLLRRSLAGGLTAPDAHLALAQIELVRGDHRAAVAELSPLLADPVRAPRAAELSAFCYLMLGEPGRAAELLALPPASPDAQLLLAALALEQGDLSAARRLVRELGMPTVEPCVGYSFPALCEELSALR